MYRRFVQTNVHRVPDASKHAGVSCTFRLPWTLHCKKNLQIRVWCSGNTRRKHEILRFRGVKIFIVVFWVKTTYRLTGSYQRFRGSWSYIGKGKGKDKVHPTAGHEVPERD
jgi:hypothetical protein